MNSTLILLLVFVGVIVLYLIVYNLLYKTSKETKEQTTENESAPNKSVQSVDDSECCGQHAVCEKTSLINTKITPEYYDDEELDVLSGLNPNEYTEENINMIKDVFYTMKDTDVAGWLKSLQLRGIELTDELKEEALLVVQELRQRNNVE